MILNKTLIIGYKMFLLKKLFYINFLSLKDALDMLYPNHIIILNENYSNRCKPLLINFTGG